MKQLIPIPLPTLSQLIPERRRLSAVVPYAAVGVSCTACVLFAILVVAPAWQAMQERAGALASARQELQAREHSVGLMENALQEELDGVLELNARSAGLLLSQQRMAEVLRNLYQQAEDSGVQITDLRGQPSPKDVEGSPYQVRNLRLRATGDLLALLNLIAHVQRAAPAGGLLLENLHIEQGLQAASLIVDLTLYVAQHLEPGEYAGLPDGVHVGGVPVPELQPTPGGAPAPPEQIGPRVHTVSAGDTLYSLATRYGTTVIVLKTVNGLVEDTIYVGQTLNIPPPN